MTGQELATIAMERLGFTKPSELAERLGLVPYSSPRRVTRWLEGSSEPDYEMTIALLDLVGAINWDVLGVSPPQALEDARGLARKVRRRSREALRRAEEARDQPRPGTDRSHGGSV